MQKEEENNHLYDPSSSKVNKSVPHLLITKYLEIATFIYNSFLVFKPQIATKFKIAVGVSVRLTHFISQSLILN